MTNWDQIRYEFAIPAGIADFTVMAMAYSPRVVRDALRVEREAMDQFGYRHVAERNPQAQVDIFDQLENYFAVKPEHAALSWTTTAALAQIYSGIRMREGQEMLTSLNDHPATVEALRMRCRRHGNTYRQAALYRDSRTVTADEIVNNVRNALRPHTRILGLTWVSSADGVKLPVARIAQVVAEENRHRAHDERLLLVLDGVHGFGVEDTTFPALGCDFFAAGCHKWLLGPRGTAVICGTADAWTTIVPLAATSSPASLGIARAHVLGGVKAYENQWALRETFDFLLDIGKKEIQARVQALTGLFKQKVSRLPRVALRTPFEPDLSAGIVCLDIEGVAASSAIETLREKHGIRVTESVWDATTARTHVRLAISLINSEAEIDAVLRALS